MVNILFIGDINGKPGRNAVKTILPSLIKEKQIDFVIANGENSAGGFGITEKTFKELISSKINVITGGNHTWDKKEVITTIINEPAFLRPENYPPANPGRGYGIFTITKNSKTIKIGVISLLGRIFMLPVDCPFRAADKVLNEITANSDIIIADIHAEATSEKQALAFYLDGRLTGVFGTHTHVQTSDERILEKGTAFITDAGMTGPFDSVIGVEKEVILRRFLTMMPEKFNIASNNVHLNAVLLQADENTGKALKIERIDIKIET